MLDIYKSVFCVTLTDPDEMSGCDAQNIRADP